MTPAPAKTQDPEALPRGQREALALVKATPGMTIREVAVALGCSHATATYYLMLLVRSRLLSRHVDGREVRHYPTGAGNPVDRVKALCRDERVHAVVLFACATARPVSVNRAAKALGFSFGFTKRALARIQELGFHVMDRSGVRYFVKHDRHLTALVRADPALSAIASFGEKTP